MATTNISRSWYAQIPIFFFCIKIYAYAIGTEASSGDGRDTMELKV